MKKVTDYSRKWLKISRNITEYLSKPETVKNLDSIRKVPVINNNNTNNTIFITTSSFTRSTLQLPTV